MTSKLQLALFDTKTSNDSELIFATIIATFSMRKKLHVYEKRFVRTTPVELIKIREGSHNVADNTNRYNVSREKIANSHHNGAAFPAGINCRKFSRRLSFDIRDLRERGAEFCENATSMFGFGKLCKSESEFILRQFNFRTQFFLNISIMYYIYKIDFCINLKQI